MLARQARQRHRQRIEAVVGEYDKRPYEIVPCPQQGEHRKRHDDGLEQRNNDGAEYTEFAGAIDARRLEQLVGNGQRVLAHEKDAEDAGHRRHDHAAVAIDQSQMLEQEKQRHHRDLRRDDERAEEQLEYTVASGEMELGKRIPGGHIESQRHQCDGGGEKDAVGEISADASVGKELAIVP